MENFEETFKGAVKISDVQNSFDNIVNRINNLIDSYNSSSYIEDIDYSVGAKSLAPAGYSLSVGGLKQILKAYDGCVIGAKPFKTSSNKIIITDGILITKDEVYRLPCEEINIGSNGTVYFNTAIKQYTTNKVANCIKVCDVNIQSESLYCKHLKGVLTEDFNGKYEVTVEPRVFSRFCGTPFTVEYPDTSKSPKFVCGMEGVRGYGEEWARTYLFNELVSYNWQPENRRLNFWQPANFLFLPKGINNPYRVEAGDTTKTYNANIQKEVE